MATKVKTGVIDSSAITSALIANASITADDLHTTLDLTGKTVTVSTASAGDNDTSVASTAYVDVAIANLADSAPSTLNTLNELAAALGDDPNYATTTTAAIAGKLPLSGGTLTGHLKGTSFGSGISATVGITGSVADLNSADLGPGYLTLARDDTADAAQLRFAKNGSVHSYLETRTLGLGFVAEVGGFIFEGGNVGIGNTNPSELLSLYKTSGTTLVQAAVHANSTVGFEIKKTNATTQTWRIADGQTVNGVLEFYDATNSATRMAIKGDGNVGIGTTAPSNLLSIKGSGQEWDESPAIKLWDATYSKGWYVGTANNQAAGDYYIRSVTSESAYPVAADQQFTITQGGNVGIGTIAPSYKLEVNGQVKSAEGLHSNNWQIYNTGTNGFLIGTNILANNYAHIHGEIKLQQFNYSTQQIINFSATVAATGVTSSAASSDIPVTIKLFMYAGTWYIWVPSPTNYTDISAYIHMGSGYQGTSRSSNAITSLSSAGVPSSGVTNSVDISGIARTAAPGHVIQTVYTQSASLVVPSQTINDYTTFIQVNITPKYSTSKILITGIAGVEVGSGNYPTVHCRLYRDSTHIKSYLYWGYEGAQTTHRILNEPMHYLDSPTTTSALTYYAKLANSSGSSYSGTYSGKAHTYNPSTFMVQEIAQ